MKGGRERPNGIIGGNSGKRHSVNSLASVIVGREQKERVALTCSYPAAKSSPAELTALPSTPVGRLIVLVSVGRCTDSQPMSRTTEATLMRRLRLTIFTLIALGKLDGKSLDERWCGTTLDVGDHDIE